MQENFNEWRDFTQNSTLFLNWYKDKLFKKWKKPILNKKTELIMS